MEVRLSRGRKEVEDALELRKRVFCGEQGVSLRAERDGRDAEAKHVVALEDGRLIGTGRLLLGGGVARLSRVAVDPAFRRRGVGRALVDAAERFAREAGATRVSLHAQLPVRGLYDAAGYEQRGEPFIEEGIEHVVMDKRLA